MCDTIFAFGQRGSYHFETKSLWYFGRLPEKLAKLFSTTEANKISSCYHVALGANQSFFISYKSTDGLDRIYGDGLPESLQTWLYQRDEAGEYIRHFPKLRVTLGPYDHSFFAMDGSAWRWLNLPKGLNDAIKTKRSNDGTGPFIDMPRVVALGVDENYFMLTEKNAASWNLGGYRALSELISKFKDSEGGLSDIKDLYLHPYRLQTCIIQNTSGQVAAASLPAHVEEAFERIKIAIEADTLAETKPFEGLETERNLVRLKESRGDTQRDEVLAQPDTLQAQQRQMRRQQTQAQLRQLNQMIKAMNLGVMKGNFGFGGKLF